MSAPRDPALARSAARLAAVQALYQMEISGTPGESVIEEFREHRFGAEGEGAAIGDADDGHFVNIVRGVVAKQGEIDTLLDAQLSADWKITRIDSILRALMRAAAYELLARADIPAKVIVNEYVDIAGDFFTGDEPKFANGVLDKLARKLRAAEF